MALELVARGGGRRSHGPMHEADWIATWREFWEGRFDRLADYLKRQNEERQTNEEKNDGRDKPSNDP